MKRAMKRLAAVVVVVLAVLGTAAPSQARGGGGHGVAGGHALSTAHPGARFDGHRGFERHFDAHRAFHRGVRGGVLVAPSVPFWWYDPPAYAYVPPPVYSAPAPAYWYYCASAGGYYPNVPSCPQAWIPVPAQ